MSASLVGACAAAAVTVRATRIVTRRPLFMVAPAINGNRLVQLLRMDTSICHNAHLGESMGQHRALYQIGGISPGQKNDFTTARPLAKARDFRSGSMNGHDAL